MLGLMVAQLCLGFLAFITRVMWGRDAAQPELPMVISTVVHVAVGALLLATTVVLAIQVWRHVPVAFEERVPGRDQNPRRRLHSTKRHEQIATRDPRRKWVVTAEFESALLRPFRAKPEGQPIIAVRDLIHRYQDRTALNGVSFDVRPAELFGLLGPNGSGKTTLFRILSTLMMPTSGSATIAGIDAVRQPSALAPPHRRRLPGAEC